MDHKPETAEQQIGLSLAEQMKSFYRNQLLLVFCSLAAVFLCYYRIAFTMNIGIDTEQFILGSYNPWWMLTGVGRFGYYWSELLFNVGQFSPYANGMVFLVFFSAAVLLWPFVFSYVQGRTSRWYLLFTLAFVTCPIWMHQFYFTLQTAAVAFALFLQAISFLMLLIALMKEGLHIAWRILLFTVSVLCAFYAIGTYQAFAGLHITEAAACLLLLFDRLVIRGDKPRKRSAFWKRAGLTVLHFLLSYGLYTGLCKIMKWGTSDYLSVAWGKASFSDIIGGLTANMKDLLLGRGDYTGWIFLAGAVLLLMNLIRFYLKKRPFGEKADFTLLILGNLLSGFALHFAIGYPPVIRARLAIVFSAAFLILYAAQVWDECRNVPVRKVLLTGLAACTAVSVFLQAQQVQKYQYTMDVCEAQQYDTATDIVRRLRAKGLEDNATVVVLGYWNPPLNPACTPYDMIGRSSFCWDYNEENATSGTRRALLYLNASQGTCYSMTSDSDLILSAYEAAEYMPAYPEEGSVTNADGLGVIKLSAY